MFEDNPFYTVEFINNDEELSSSKENTEEQAIDNPTIIMNNENLQLPENKKETTSISIENENIVKEENSIKEKKSTGVSTYIEVPDITKESIECNTNLITNIDKFNLWFVFGIFVLILANFKKRKFNKIMEKITEKIKKHSFIYNIINLGIIFALFSTPKFLGTGISGKLSLFTMIEFSLFIFINAIVITFLIINKMKNKNFLLKNKKYTFSGINFLEKSLITFSFTGFLFFLFTESQIAFILLYIFTILTSLFFFIQTTSEENYLYENLITILISIEISIIGGLTNLFIIMLIGAIMTGYYYPESKKTILEIKQIKE